MAGSAANSKNNRCVSGILTRLVEVGEEGMTVGGLADEFGRDVPRCVVRLAFGQYVEAHDLFFAAIPMEPPAGDDEMSDLRWRCPHPLNQRGVVAHLVAAKTRVRLSPYGVLLLGAESVGTKATMTLTLEEASLRLSELLKAICQAPESLDRFVRMIRDSDVGGRYRRQAEGWVDKLWELWRSGIAAFSHSVLAHVQHGNLKTERDSFGVLLRMLRRLERHNPYQLDDEFFDLLGAVDTRSASFLLELQPVVRTKGAESKKAAPKKKAPRGELEGIVEALLRKSADLSLRDLATTTGWSKSTIIGLAAWKHHTEGQDVLREGSARAMKAKQGPINRNRKYPRR